VALYRYDDVYSDGILSTNIHDTVQHRTAYLVIFLSRNRNQMSVMATKLSPNFERSWISWRKDSTCNHLQPLSIYRCLSNRRLWRQSNTQRKTWYQMVIPCMISQETWRVDLRPLLYV